MTSFSSFLKDLRIKSDISSVWNSFFNKMLEDKKINSAYNIIDISLTRYGFDVHTTIPVCENLYKLNKLLPFLSELYDMECIALYTENKENIVVKFYSEQLDMTDIDMILLKWYKFLECKECFNNKGETFILYNAKPIINLENKKIGYTFDIKTPLGLYIDILKDNINKLNSIFDFCEISGDKINILLRKISDDEKYIPLKVKPYEFYCGLSNSYKQIILNFKNVANLLIGGTVNTGKTMIMIIGLLNLINSNSEKEVNLFMSMISNKQDLNMFFNTKQCKYYSKSLTSTLHMLKYLDSEMKRRNELFSKYDYVFNIYDYNKKTSEKLPIIYLCIDEISNFASNNTTSKTKEDNLKDQCNSLLWKIAREGRSCGIYCLFCTQRGSITNLSGDIKALLVNQICFYFPNKPSALTILGDEELSIQATKLQRKREFICVSEEVIVGKSLFLDDSTMRDILKKNYGNYKLNIDKNGNIISAKIDN